MTSSLRVLVFLFMAIFAYPVNARVVPVSPFAGALSETWESFTTTPKGDYLPVPTTIMGGQATVSHFRMTVFDSTLPVGLGTSGSAQPSDGSKAMSIGALAATTTIIFTDPSVRFGSYWGAITEDQDPNIGDPAYINVNFFDAADSPIGSDVFTYSRSQFGDGVLEWHGWSSTTPIKRITYTGNAVVVDGLQADPVPEPAAISLLFLAAACLRRTQPNHSNRA